MANLTGLSSLSEQFNQTNTTGLINPLTLSARLQPGVTYSGGTGSGQVDLLYAAQLTLAATPTTLDLTALTDLHGDPVNFARVRELAIQVVTTTAGFSVIVGAANSFPWSGALDATGTITIPPGGVSGFSDPFSTGAGVGPVVLPGSKNLKLDPGANTVVVNVLIAGTSVA